MSKKLKSDSENSSVALPSRREKKRANHILKLGRKWLWIQRDVLSESLMNSCRVTLEKLEASLKTGSKSKLLAGIEEAEKQFHAIKPHSAWSGWRENFEAIFVALVIAGAVRTYFVQPFKIPTGSMQPTLYGTYPSPRERPTPYAEGKKPGGLERFFGGIVMGKTYYEDGYRLSGDRIFVDRFSCNFIRPTRGDIVVFRTRNMRESYRQEGADFYIKRLVGLGGEHLQIRDGQILINGETIRKPSVFETIYQRRIAEGTELKGYVTLEELGKYDLDKRVPRTSVEIFSPSDNAEIPSRHCFVLGDNTSNSTDSRYWGTIPRRDIIGRAFLIYWP